MHACILLLTTAELHKTTPTVIKVVRVADSLHAIGLWYHLDMCTSNQSPNSGVANRLFLRKPISTKKGSHGTQIRTEGR
jgi:hypothetical protein